MEYNKDGMLVDPKLEEAYAEYIVCAPELVEVPTHISPPPHISPPTPNGSGAYTSYISTLAARVAAKKAEAEYEQKENYKDGSLWILYLHNKIGFGKHKTKTLKEVIDNFYDYFTWMRDNDVIVITIEIRDYLKLIED